MLEQREKFSKNIKAERIRAGYTQEETAEKLGITNRQYQNYEKHHRVDAITLFKLSQIFNCSIEAFFINL